MSVIGLSIAKMHLLYPWLSKVHLQLTKLIGGKSSNFLIWIYRILPVAKFYFVCVSGYKSINLKYVYPLDCASPFINRVLDLKMTITYSCVEKVGNVLQY